MTMESLRVIMVDLDVDGQQSLVVLLDQEGLVNRLGTGAVNNTERKFFIGRTDQPLFAQLRDKVDSAWITHQGAYEVPEKRGSLCTLTIMFQHADGQENAIRFRYGSESEGPPGDICHFVAEAVRLTDPWYGQQKLLAGGEARAKPWWKLW